MAEPIEIILLRQWASYLGLPVWIMDAEGSLIFYNEAAELLLGGRRFEESGAISVEDLSSLFSTRGTATLDHYSLKGFSAALKAIGAACAN